MLKAVEITTAIGCYEMCPYCPQDKLVNKYVGSIEMNMQDFSNYLAMIDKDYAIHFSGFCEPYVNALCSDMIRLCIETGRKVIVFSRLKYCSDYDYEILNMLPEYSLYLHYDKTHVYDFYKLDKPQTVISVGEDIQTSDIPGSWRILKQDLITRAGNIGISDNPEDYKAKECSSKRYSQPVILPNGDVVICCMDYNLDYVIGNLNEQTLNEIYSGERYKEFIDNLSCGKNNLCNKCFRGVE